jgi:putative N6-adenine-specific DNA methylase
LQNSLVKFAAMQNFDKKNRIIITCHKWFSISLEKEVIALGFQTVRVFQTGVELYGSINDCIKLNLNLRCASQVLFSLQSFYCNHPNDLYNAVVKIEWQKIIAKDGFFSVTSNVFHPTINNNLFANVRVKDGIVDVMRTANGVRTNTGNDLSKTVIHLFWKNEDAELFLDTSGESLAKHGYRKIPGKAPMLEALAAATILTMDWNGETPFINPMCGSGTLAIEAALIATNRRPGLYRKNYAFMHILGYSDTNYTTELQQLFDQIIDKPNLKIIASDISEDAIYISKINAGIADVEDLIIFEKGDFAVTQIPNDYGIIMLNPEYGERLGEVTDLEETYSRIGDFFKQKCAGYMGYIFTGNLDLAKKIGLKPKRKTEFLNGKIDCRLFQYELYAGTKRDT